MLSMLPSWARTSLVDDRVTPAAAIVGILTVALMTFAISKRSTSPSQNPQTYYLPYTLRNWPWERIISPHYLAAQAESVAWLESFHPFTKKAQIAFNKCDFSLVSALTFPKANHYNLRSCCDLMHTFFTLDEYTDLCDGPGAKALCDATMDAILNPDKPRPKGESIIGEITRQFWKRASVKAPKACQERFVKAWRTYLGSVVLQAERRSSSYICTIDEYMAARRDNIGSDPSFALLEISLEVDIPHSVMQHPAIVSLNRDTTDMIVLANDMCSYKKEVLCNDADYNAITVVMANEKTDLAGALQWISNIHDEIVDRFLSTRQDVLNKRNGVPSWGKEIDEQVAAYVDGLGQWIRGHDEWNFQSGRYFGNNGLEIQKSRTVVIA
ncbi:hypothetical protein HWV62_42763 [Athelia sp. TMB]|nr:hypothetical protein HWV62_42763 [Athelia sp. TMB]